MVVQTRTKRQLAWVFDLNKCIGCQTCTVACKVQWPGDESGMGSMWWMTVNTQPGRGTPRDWETMGGGYVDGRLQIGREPTEEEIGTGWDYNYDEVLAGGRGLDAQLKKISGNPSWGINWDEDEGDGTYPNSYFFYLPRLCAHCTKPACVEACPHDAIFKRDEDGIVLIDESICQGDRSCIGACPYKKIDFNRQLNISQKCIGCFPRVDHGVAPVCVRSCPARAAFIGFLDDESSPVHKLVRQWNVALPLHAEFGVEPNVYYVPPLAPHALHPDGSADEAGERIPPAYLESLFGPAVHTALAALKNELAKRRNGATSALLDTLIVYHWHEALGHLRRDPAGIDWKTETKGEQR